MSTIADHLISQLDNIMQTAARIEATEAEALDFVKNHYDAFKAKLAQVATALDIINFPLDFGPGASSALLPNGDFIIRGAKMNVHQAVIALNALPLVMAIQNEFQKTIDQWNEYADNGAKAVASLKAFANNGR